jgi:hypothetical protein
MWPTKPAYGQISGYVTVAYFGLDPSVGSSDPTMVGSAYMYGGWFVAIIGMFLLGIVCGVLYRGLALPGLRHKQVGLLATYAGVMIANFHIGEGDVAGTWQGVIQRLVVFAIVVLLLSTRNNHPPKPLSSA